VNGPAQLGLMQTLLAVAGFVLMLAWCARRRQISPEASSAVLLALLAGVAFVLMLQPAAPFWEHVPFGRSLQFPDRLLGMMAFLLAVLAGGLSLALRRLPSVAAGAATLALSGLLIYGAVGRLDLNYVSLPGSITPTTVVESEQSNGAIATTAKGEYTPVWMAEPALASPLLEGYLTGRTPVIAGGNGAQVELLQRAPDDQAFRISAASAGPVELPVTYYPGWTASLGDGQVRLQPDQRGLISIQAPAGQSEARLHFGPTPDRWLGIGLGLASLLILLALIFALLRSPSVQDQERAGVRAPSRSLAALLPTAAGLALLAIVLYVTPGKLQLAGWPTARPELVSYKDWLQFMGSDVRPTKDAVRVSAVFRTGAAQSAFPLTATVRLLTRETVWSSASQPLTADGWTTMLPRRLEFNLPLAAGTPPGVYLLELQLRRADGGILGPDWSKLTYDAPRVGPVLIGPVTIGSRTDGPAGGRRPSNSDFGVLELAGWQPPSQAAPGDFVPINLWWRAVAARPDADWVLSLHLVDAQGKVWAGHDDQPRFGYNATSLWQTGQVERDVQMLLLPRDMPPGQYTVDAGWYEARTKAPVGPRNMPIGSLDVQPVASH